MRPLASLLALWACHAPPTDDGSDGPSETWFWPGEGDVLPALLARPITVTGRVAALDGGPVAGASVTLGDATGTTDADGSFHLSPSSRRNALLHVTADGFRPMLRAVQLLVPDDVVDLEPVLLTDDDPSVVRFLFGGDTAFGRRYLDPEDATPRNQIPADHPDALIQASDPGPGSVDVVSRAAPLFELADFPVVNLESPVTDHPDTPHMDKAYAFFTLPGSLEALRSLGLSYVAGGNNHVYDYLDPGVEDTLRNLDAAGLRTSGNGHTPDQAVAPARVDLAGRSWSFVSACSVSGDQWDIGYLANQDHGGAADLLDDDLFGGALRRETAAGSVPIAILHTGVEYSWTPSDTARDRERFAIEQGAKLVVAMHPHVAQGFRLVDGVLAADCLGNFAFDQDRHETFPALVVAVEMRGAEERAAVAWPIYIEDYRPRPATGALAHVFLRRIAEMSDPDGLWAVPVDGQLWLFRDPARVETTSRTVTVDVPIDDRGAGVLDARSLLRGDESVASVRVTSGTATRLRAGRDLLLYGGFEDEDVDEDVGEASRWDLTGASSDVCFDRAHTGVAALCSARDSGNESDSVVAFRNRVRVRGDAENVPQKDLSLALWAKGENEGPVTVEARYYASEEDAEFGGEDAYVSPGGTFDWTFAWKDLSMPPDGPDPADPAANARAVRLFLRHSPPDDGEGLAVFDDFAIVSWEDEVTSGEALRVPNARDFVRVEGPPGTVTLELTLSELRPKP